MQYHYVGHKVKIVDIAELKKQVNNAINGFGSKSYTRILTKSYPSLTAELEKVTAKYNPKNLNESIYILLNEPPIICSNGQRPLFNSYELGYRDNCGKAGVCACAKKSQQEKLKIWHETLDQEQREKMNTKAKDTFVKNLGVTNPMLSSEVKQRVQQTCIEKYGANSPVESNSIKEKIEKANLEKYGVAYPFQKEEIRQKSVDTTLNRYGKLMTQARGALYEKYDGINPWHIKEVQDKRTSTMIDKYKTPHALQNQDVYDKMVENNLIKYGRPNPAQLNYSEELWNILNNPEVFLQVVKGKNSVQVAREIGAATSDLILSYARKYNVLDQMVFEPQSAMEDDLKAWLLAQNVQFKQHDRTILPNRLEIDFYFPEYNFGVELNHLQTHAELSCGKGRDYHFSKFKGCEIKKIQLLQYWQSEYWQHKSVIQSKILYLCNKITKKIQARKTEVVEIYDTNIERGFLNANHVQGFADYRQHTVAAYYDGKLIGIMSFAKTMGRMELIRYATDTNIVCSGLFSKMLKHAVQTFKFSGKIVSLSDNRVSNGNLYLQSGWTYEKEISPEYFYTIDYETILHKQNFRKEKLIKRFDLDPEWVANTTEWQIVQELGYDRVWDAGKKRWSIAI